MSKAETNRTALYAGSFDPMTNGHLDVLRAGLSAFDTVVVAVGVHPGKKPLFSFQEREQLIYAACKDMGLDECVSVISFGGLVVDAARKVGAGVLLRGLRDGTDFDYEMQMAGMNMSMAPDIQTIFVPASAGTRSVTGTLVRQIAAMGGDISDFVPKVVLAACKKKHS